MPARWSADSVLALAPDNSSRRAAAPLARPVPWDGAGAAGELVWGLCAGSGKTPYQVIVDLAGPAFKCSCPSRKFPCKHALGLLLLWSAGVVPDRPEPADYARTWHETRQAKAKPPSRTDRGDSLASADSAAGPDEAAGSGSAGGDPAGSGDSDPAGSAGGDPASSRGRQADDAEAARRGTEAARRAAERSRRVADGLSDLREWLRDQVRTGLANTGPGQLDLMTARMVDAQAPGVAAGLRGLTRVAASGAVPFGAVASRSVASRSVVSGSVASGALPSGASSGIGDSRARLLSEYAMLHLLIRAHERLDQLPEGFAAVVRSRVGYTTGRDEVLGRPAVTGHWHVLAVRSLTDAAVPGRRIWLRGREAGRWAMLLTFAAPSGAWQDPATARLRPGTEIHADLHYYPGQPPLRALIGTRHGDPVPVGPPERLGSDNAAPDDTAADDTAADDIDVLLAEWSAAIAADPWLTTWPALLRGIPVPPRRAADRWQFATESGTALPLADRESLWTLLAISGGKAVTVAGEWHPDGLVALTTWHAGQAVTL